MMDAVASHLALEQAVMSVFREIAVYSLLLSVPGPSVAGQTTDTLRVLVGSHRLFFLASGASGGPTVVLEAGDRSTHRAWRTLRPLLEQFSRVVAYDRAGLGQSEMGPAPRDARTIAGELRAGLRAAGLAPPYILVGHSAGGPLVRVFAGMFPEAVAGVVLLDPAAEEAYPRAEREYPELYRRLDQADSADRVNGTPGELAEDAQWEVWLAQARVSDSTL